MNNFAELTDTEIVELLSQDYQMPTMFRFNGCGSTMLGKLKADKGNNYYFKMFCFTLAYLPLYLRSVYYVHESGSTVHSLGYLSKRDFKRIFGAKLYRKLVFSVLWDFFSILLIVLAITVGILLYVLYEKQL